MRLLAPKALLYTEMLTTGAIHHNPTKSLVFNPIEHPIAIQLGGADKQALAECAIAAEQEGYDEINLNLGCPSNKVQAGRFGACLMNEPTQVAECIHAMKQVVTIPVTAKTRIGIDNQDSYPFFSDFVHKLVDAGCDKLIVHARKAWLNGLNPKQNRTIPAINYDFVYRIKQEINIPVIINGNIATVNEVKQHLNYVDGIMVGRLACDNPFYLSQIHEILYPEILKINRSQLFQVYLDYLITEHRRGASLSLLVKPIFNLAHALPGANQWKKKLMQIIQTRNIELFAELTDYLLQIESCSV
jgi:tRNA-dihydrouridine synthase A